MKVWSIKLRIYLFFKEFALQVFVSWVAEFSQYFEPFSCVVASPVRLNSRHTETCFSWFLYKTEGTVHVSLSERLVLRYLVAHLSLKSCAASWITRVSYCSFLHIGQHFLRENLSNACRHLLWKTWEQDSNTWNKPISQCKQKASMLISRLHILSEWPNMLFSPSKKPFKCVQFEHVYCVGES